MPLTAGHPWVNAPVNPVFRWSRVQLSCRNARHYVEAGAYVKRRQTLIRKEGRKSEKERAEFSSGLWIQCSANTVNTHCYINLSHAILFRTFPCPLFAPSRKLEPLFNTYPGAVVRANVINILHIDSARDIISHIISLGAAVCRREWEHSTVGFTDILYMSY